MALSVRDIRELLHHRLVPALPVPFTIERTIHSESHIRIAEYMLDMPIAGVAVWAHTGRGLYLSEAERADILTHWRDAMPSALVIAGAGCPANEIISSDEEYVRGARRMAEHAKSLGADAVLCYPPTRFRDRDDRERMEATVEYHRQISMAGLPLILFYLYESAGGLKYSPTVLNELFKLPNVIGIKMATLDSVVTFQDVARMIKAEHPDRLIITGEDRFLGYSLMMGADSALIGMGAAFTGLQAEMMKAFYTQDFDNFFYRSPWVDRFSLATFHQPMEGYISRMLYALAWMDIVSRDAIYDPWGPALDASDLDAVGDFLTMLPTVLKR
jgi:4-hydroxy-tetrahydrodipicolinate synthase